MTRCPLLSVYRQIHPPEDSQQPELPRGLYTRPFPKVRYEEQIKLIPSYVTP